MPIQIITGQPGNGKTLLMMEILVSQSKKTKGKRPLYAAGIEGLEPGLSERLDDPRDWNAIDPTGQGEYCTVSNCSGGTEPHVHLVPDGSLIFVDEAWKWFGHLHDARQAPTPKHVLGLAEHRHRGIDFVMTTQMANQLYPFMRGLVGSHTHVVRRFGLKICDLYQWGELCDDVSSQTKRERAIKTVWPYPSELFPKYKSATQHTIKSKLPWRLYAVPLIILAVVFCAFRFWVWYHNSATATAATLQQGAASGGAAAATSGDPQHSEAHKLTPAEYSVQLQPRLAAQPWTAPVYDGRQTTADPMILCAITATGKYSTCHCYTEQATPYMAAPITEGQCRDIAVNGIYNPYRQKPEPPKSDFFNKRRTDEPAGRFVTLQQPTEQSRRSVARFAEPSHLDDATDFMRGREAR